MKYLIPLLVFALLPLSLQAEEKGVRVKVTVTNIPGVKGNLLVGLYDSAKTFTKKPMDNSKKVKITSTRPITVTLNDVKPGTYAISVIQDLNENGKLDKSRLGLPTEPLAFSTIKKIPRGKPSFKACSFEVESSDIKMTIPLVTE